jgi:hypothetical protein
MLAANIIICETVLREQKPFLSAIRIFNISTAPKDTKIVRFFAITALTEDSADTLWHQLVVRLVRGTQTVAEAPASPFFYVHDLDPTAPGAYTLTTEFTVKVELSGVHYVEAVLDGAVVARTAITLHG